MGVFFACVCLFCFVFFLLWLNSKLEFPRSIYCWKIQPHPWYKLDPNPQHVLRALQLKATPSSPPSLLPSVRQLSSSFRMGWSTKLQWWQRCELPLSQCWQAAAAWSALVCTSAISLSLSSHLSPASFLSDLCPSISPQTFSHKMLCSFLTAEVKDTGIVRKVTTSHPPTSPSMPPYPPFSSFSILHFCIG